MAAIIIVLALVLGLAVLPQLWVKKVIARHSGERADFPGTGGEFARRDPPGLVGDPEPVLIRGRHDTAVDLSLMHQRIDDRPGAMRGGKLFH